MKTNKIIGGLLVVLLVLVGLRLGQNYFSKQQNEVSSYSHYWEGLGVADVNSILVSQGENSLKINKLGEHSWQVNEYTADATKIEEWLPKLLRPESTQLVSESSTQHENLGISSSSAVLTIATPKGDKLVTLGSPTVGGKYVKFADSDNVYLVGELPDSVGSVKPSSWIDPVIARISQANISQITITKGKENVIIKKSESGWVNEAGKEIDTTPFNSLLMTLESFATQGLAELTADLPKQPTIRVAVTQASGEPVVFLLYEIEDNVYVNIEGKPGIYTLSPTSLKNFDIEASDLKLKE